MAEEDREEEEIEEEIEEDEVEEGEADEVEDEENEVDEKVEVRKASVELLQHSLMGQIDEGLFYLKEPEEYEFLKRKIKYIRVPSDNIVGVYAESHPDLDEANIYFLLKNGAEIAVKCKVVEENGESVVWDIKDIDYSAPSCCSVSVE